MFWFCSMKYRKKLWYESTSIQSSLPSLGLILCIHSRPKIVLSKTILFMSFQYVLKFYVTIKIATAWIRTIAGRVTWPLCQQGMWRPLRSSMYLITNISIGIRIIVNYGKVAISVLAQLSIILLWRLTFSTRPHAKRT